ncbi:hypothetical protein A9B99_20970 [Mangrovibacter phragmitis]|uniref:Knr4/Smi1-like domain-containing protein n=1 Tax=Mangrovibacter phragmitis TaxID=1691903 RepID=A0A1B7L5C4_9ENTR|nr:SMI1/KNR4 family protein [Mangrovibacter phragmitis]OAT77523.1 hypothetical protein A9B99_20970 [Mangrovibacter phragmitis]
MTLVERHLEKVRLHLSEENQKQWAVLCGATEQALAQLVKLYPLCPPELQQLLSKVDGTYWKKYDGKMVNLLLLASDAGEDFGYYLLSCEQIQEEQHFGDSISDIYGEWLGQTDAIYVDNRIDTSVAMSERLCFAHCLNNGGTSRLYIDFHPAPGGTCGQVVRFLHDPDSYIVLAESFEAYIAGVLESNYAFVSEY